MDRLALLIIWFYQRFLSPYKGYRCAYGVLHHTEGCSGAVKQIIRQKGVIAGWTDIRQRFVACRQAAMELQDSSLSKNERDKPDKAPKKKKEYCDTPCGDGLNAIPDCSDVSCPEIPECSCPCDGLSLRLFRPHKPR